MIDIHCHILPGLDDGARDMEEAVEMGRLAYADGIRTLVATPHCRNGLYQNNELTILPVLGSLKQRLIQNGIGLNLISGADIHIQPQTVSFLRQNPRLLLGGRYFLIEFPAQSIPPYTRDFIFQALLAGFVPIITHPERNTMIQQHWEDLEEWVRAGALVQVTAQSLTGGFGSPVKELALNMVRKGLVQVVATDAHSLRRRPPILSKALEVLSRILGPDEGLTLVRDNPEKILKGETIETISPRVGAKTRNSLWNQLVKDYWKRLKG